MSREHSRLITDYAILQPEIPPDEILLRDAKLDHLRSVLEPIQVGQPVDGAFIYGPPTTSRRRISIVGNVYYE